MSLELTTEYFKTPTVAFKAPERVVSVEQVAPDRYKYRVYRLFRVYPTVDACLDDHLALLKKPMYADAWPYRGDAKEYARRLVDNTGAKYATAPNYAAMEVTAVALLAALMLSLAFGWGGWPFVVALLLYYIIYFVEAGISWVYNTVRRKLSATAAADTAYYASMFEMEAHANEGDNQYIRGRKSFNWIRYFGKV